MTPTKEHEDAKLFKLEVINTILKKSLASALLKERLSDIFSYLVAIEKLGLEAAASLFLVDQDTARLVRAVVIGHAGNHCVNCNQIPFGHCYCGRAAKTKKLQFVAAGSDEHSLSHGHYCVPMILNDMVIGVMDFFTPQHHHYSELTAETLVSAAEIVTALIDNQKMDLQVRKEMEKMNRLSTIAEIASAVAHEVRNPLAGIKIMAQSIEENSAKKEDRIECSRRIVRQVDRLNELLTDFFSYARPVTPKKRLTTLSEILSETKPLVAGKLEAQRIQLVENFPEPLPPVIADPNQLQQVFLNLFLNAIDAIRQEGVIEITARTLKSHEVPLYCKAINLLQKGIPYMMVHFRDNGAGMSRTGSERVFEPFYTTKTNGSGLGMSIVYRTLQENDATITVSSTEGKGTTFTMFFKTGG